MKMKTIGSGKIVINRHRKKFEVSGLENHFTGFSLICIRDDYAYGFWL